MSINCAGSGSVWCVVAKRIGAVVESELSRFKIGNTLDTASFFWNTLPEQLGRAFM